MSFNNNTDSLNTINMWNNCTVADERSQILTWLSSLEPRVRHRDIQDRRVENIGEWLLQTEEFRSWYAGSEGCGSDNAVLLCYGDPGVGKTYISSLVIDSLCDQAGGQDVAVACCYFDFAAQKQQSSTSILGALLKQVVGGMEGVPAEIVQAYSDQKKVIGGREPRLPDIVKMLQIASSEKRTFICIDALDECAAEYRVKLLNSLNQIIQESPDIRIFVTGRPHVRDEVWKRLFGRVLTIPITPRRGDIIRYLHSRLDEDTTPDAMDSSLEADILRKIPEDISEIFLLVSLNVDAILQEATIHHRRQKLNAMTDGLGLEDAYGATLCRIKGQGGRKAMLGMASLMWISHSERPLKSDELCHALAVEIGSPNLNSHNIPSIGTLLACCQGLVVVDRETSTIRLIHFTVQEYLRVHPELFGAAHSAIAETCLSYLNSQQVKAFSANPTPALRSTPFLEYASLHWGLHAKRNLSDRAKLLALKLFDDYNNHISTKILLKAQGWYTYNSHFANHPVFSGLHCASIFGIDEIATDLVEAESCDINQNDCVGNTSLVWAARNGHEGVVQILLGQDDIDPDKPNRYGRTPLCCAASNGHEGVVKILLGRDDVDPNRPNVYNRTPLCCATLNGHESVVKILLGRDDVNPDKLNEDGQTPLCWASENGHKEVVKVLLDRDDVNPDRPDDYGQTPLCLATCNGHEEVANILLGRDEVDPERQNEDGQTPLCWASESGCEIVVKTLLERDDVNPSKPNAHGQTPLCCASLNGHEGVVEMLLRRGDVNPNEPDRDDRTPLCYAAWGGHEGVVKILLGRGDVNPDSPNVNGRAPLCVAALNGHEGVVQMLLRRDEVNPDKLDKDGQTALCHAALNGHEGVVTILRGRDHANPAKRCKLG